jgi:hypothetical protein
MQAFTMSLRIRAWAMSGSTRASKPAARRSCASASKPRGIRVSPAPAGVISPPAPEGSSVVMPWATSASSPKGSRSTPWTQPFCSESTPTGAMREAVSAAAPVSFALTRTSTQSAPGRISGPERVRHEALGADAHALRSSSARACERATSATGMRDAKAPGEGKPEGAGPDDGDGIAGGHAVKYPNEH